MPKLFSSARVRRAAGQRPSLGEMFLRLNYMASIFWSSISVLFLMVFPFNGHLLTPLTLIAAVPYFVAMALDLRYCGYKTLDIARLYGFNLLLLPGQPRRDAELDRAGGERDEGPLPPHPEGAQPDRAGAHLRRPAVRPRRDLGVHGGAGLPPRSVVGRGVRRGQRRARRRTRSSRSSVLRHSLVDIWMQRRLLAAQAAERTRPRRHAAGRPRRARRPSPTGSSCSTSASPIAGARRVRTPSRRPPRSCRRRRRFDSTRRSAMARSRASPIATAWRVTSSGRSGTRSRAPTYTPTT